MITFDLPRRRTPLVPTRLVARAAAMLLALAALAVTGCGGDSSAKRLTSIAVTPNPLTVTAGSVRTLTAEGRNAQGQPLPVTVDWAVDARVGTVDAQGRFTAATHTSSAQPVTGTLTATSGTVSASVPVTVLVGAVASLEVAAPAGSDLLHLTPGQTLALTATGLDALGNSRGGAARIAVTPAWSVEGSAAVVDDNGLLLAAQAGSGRVVAEVGGVAAGLDFAVQLPSGYSASNAAFLRPGATQTISAAGGFALQVDSAVDVPTAVVVSVADSAQTDGLQAGDDGVNLVGPVVRIGVASGALARPTYVSLPATTPADGMVQAPVTFLPSGGSLRPFVLAAPTASGNTRTVPIPPITPAAARRQIYVFDIADAAVMNGETRTDPMTYQLGPMHHFSSAQDTFLEGYGVNGAQRGDETLASGRVAIVIHGILSGAGAWNDDGFSDFLGRSKEDGGLGYDHVWGFHYRSKDHIDSNARILSGLLARAVPAGQSVDLFCHSMGGLVARQMLEVLQTSVRVDRVVMLGTPNNGSILGCEGRAAAPAFIDPTVFFADNLRHLIAAAGEPATSSSRSTQGWMGGDGLLDLGEGSTFLATLNTAPASATERVRPVYFVVASALHNADVTGSLEWLQTFPGLVGGGVENADVQRLFDEGDGCVLVSSAHVASLDQEAGNFDGLLHNQIAVRERLGGVSHIDMRKNDAVRQVLRRWWFDNVDGINLGIN